MTRSEVQVPRRPPNRIAPKGTILFGIIYNMKIIAVRPYGSYPKARVCLGEREYEAVIGRDGATNNKHEGDWKTPVSSNLPILGMYVRWDRLSKDERKIITRCDIPYHIIELDDTSSDLYNEPAKINEVSVGASHEKLWRNDHLYDIFLDLGFNRNDIKKGAGSAIFMHLSRDQEVPHNKPTAGCVALKRTDMLELIGLIDKKTTVSIEAG